MDQRLLRAGSRHFEGPRARLTGRLLHAAWAVAICLISALSPLQTAAQDIEVLLPEKESQVKYALLYSFGLLTAWPPQAFDSPDSGPFVIGVLGTKPFPEYLNRIAETKKIHNRKIEIRRFSTLDQVHLCHLLYVANTAPADAEQAVVQKFAGQPVLIVSERAPNTGKAATTIQFVIEQGTVKFMLNPEAAKAHRLQVDPRLLSLAKRALSDSAK